jgi:two-component system CheB/CheR fusion protein
MEGRGPYDVEFRSVWPDGSVHWMAAKGKVVHARDGRPVRMIGTAMDITERRRLEDELRERAQQLADADRRKDEFLAMLAHELRNPIAPLRTSLYLLREDPDQHDRYIDMAERQVKHLVRIVDDLLDVSRITRGKIVLRAGPVRLADVVKRSVELVRPLLDERGHTLDVRLPAEPVVLHADDVRLVQAFGNLLSNAASYTPAGGSISIVAEPAGEEVRIAVRDNGVGLAPELLPRVFDLFVQGDAALDRTLGGLGIGLTLVRAVAELHGGRIEARSAGTGRGSEFIVHLPARPALESVEKSGASRGAEPRSGRLRILVVEDNPDTAESFATLLGLWGHETRLALDGQAALSAAESFAPEVVFCDLGLPGMDGYEIARALRQQPGMSGSVLIALSGYGRDEDRRRALAAGFDHHLVKPADLDAVADLLTSIASARTSGSATAP